MSTPPGGALEPTVRAAMEAGFAHDFSRVRVFADGVGEAAAARVGARAVTVEHNIFFARGAYQRDVLAHELAHVVQRDLGAPALAYRNGGRDLRRVQQALRHATTIISRSVRFLPTPQVQALVSSMASVLTGFFPTGHGQIDQHGTITRPSVVIWLDMNVRRGSITGTYRHELRLYLSEERPSEEARYQANATGGEIRIFVHNVVSLPDPELIATLAHELVHLFTNIMSRAELFARRLRSTPPPLPGSAAAGGRPVSISIELADPTLGGSAAFENLRLALQHTYEPVVDFLNQQRVARGAATTLDPVAVSAVWMGRTADELLAYVIDQQVDIAVQLETSRGPGGGRVAFTVPLDPLAFFRAYAGRHWLDDPQDRRALQLPAAEPILRRAGNSAAMRAVYSIIEQWVTRPTR